MLERPCAMRSVAPVSLRLSLAQRQRAQRHDQHSGPEERDGHRDNSEGREGHCKQQNDQRQPTPPRNAQLELTFRERKEVEQTQLFTDDRLGRLHENDIASFERDVAQPFIESLVAATDCQEVE